MKKELTLRFKVKAAVLTVLGAVILLPYVLDIVRPTLNEAWGLNLRLVSAIAILTFIVFGCLYQAKPLWDRHEQP